MSGPQIIAVNWDNWFRQAWPDEGRRKLVLTDYTEIGQSRKLFLTDLELRAGVFAERSPAHDAYSAGVAEGRRQMAIETIKLCSVSPSELLSLVEKKPGGGAKKDV